MIWIEIKLKDNRKRKCMHESNEYEYIFGQNGQAYTHCKTTMFSYKNLVGVYNTTMQWMLKNKSSAWIDRDWDGAMTN